MAEPNSGSIERFQERLNNFVDNLPDDEKVLMLALLDQAAVGSQAEVQVFDAHAFEAL
jgi:hypothetical protein